MPTPSVRTRFVAAALSATDATVAPVWSVTSQVKVSPAVSGPVAVAVSVTSPPPTRKEAEGITEHSRASATYS